MFEHFGFRDVLYMLRKYWRILVSIWVVIMLAGILILGLNKMHNITASVDPDTAKVYVSSASYYITPATGKTGMQINMPGDTLSAAQQLVTVYKAMLEADFCRDYVYHKVLTVYTPERFMELAELKEQNPDMKASDFTLDTVSGFMTVSSLKGTSIINIFAQSGNEELSKTILKAYMEYITEEIPKTAMIANTEYLGGADQVLTTKVKSDGTAEKTSSSLTQMIKYVIITEIGFTLLYCLLIFVYFLVFPTLNRKSDFDPYGIPIICEIPR